MTGKKTRRSVSKDAEMPYLVASAMRGPDTSGLLARTIKVAATARIRAAWYTQPACYGFWNNQQMEEREYKRLCRNMTVAIKQNGAVYVHYLSHLATALQDERSRRYFGSRGLDLCRRIRHLLRAYDAAQGVV